MPLYPQKPQVVLVVGVNGSGKTTTIGKLASQFRAAGKSVVIAAGDTFRAAAVEQLQIWGERAGVPVLTAPEGSDPASLAFDALTKARAEGADLLMIDTAGRLQNRADLMEELAKIVRVLRKVDPTAPHNTLLVLDATTGQNAVLQVEIFRKIADVSGLVMTKLDGTAKGGVLVAWPTSSACRSMPSAWASRSTIWPPSIPRNSPARWSGCLQYLPGLRGTTEGAGPARDAAEIRRDPLAMVRKDRVCPAPPAGCDRRPLPPDRREASSRPFWRCGFAARHRRRLCRGAAPLCAAGAAAPRTGRSGRGRGARA
jgi:Ni2+-binding GTPase involved in maturation of urease and hydrogenase